MEVDGKVLDSTLWWFLYTPSIVEARMPQPYRRNFFLFGIL
jgi:hypothetical protein